MTTPFLSVCMIVKNEEAVLARALASVSGLGAELLVVDTGSTDRTVAVAEEAGAFVHHFAWINDFSAARNHAMSKATGAWILVLDADEEASPALRANVERLLRATDADAMIIPTECVDDRGLNQSGITNVRLVRNGRGYAYEGRIHETLIPSLERAKAKVASTEEISLFHHGYTFAETVRKDRRKRNKTLLEQAMRDEPNEARHWHYLGLELWNERDHAGASALFERVLTHAPQNELAAWSACNLAAILEDERQWGAAWETAQVGTKGAVGRVLSLTRLGRLALREGDADTARWCADELDRSPGDPMGSRAMAQECALELRCAARVDKEPASPKLREFLLGALKRFPNSTVIADQLVRVCEALDGRGKGVFDAMRRAGHTRTSVSAAMTVLYRGGLYEHCIELHDKSSVKNGCWAFALARTGRVAEGSAALLSFGDSAAPYCFVFGLAYADAAALEHARRVSTDPHRQALAHVLAGERVPAALVWIVALWLERALTLHEDGVASQLVACLPWSVAERTAFCALALHDYVDPKAGLELALQAPTEPASLEVIGLVAHKHGDLGAASTMLSMRANQGDASVRVYLKAADAFARLGRGDEARAMIALGRASRPHARGLVAAEALYPPSSGKAGIKGKKGAAALSQGRSLR